MATNVPAHMKAEARRALYWNAAGAIGSLAAWFVLLQLLPLILWLWRQPFSTRTVDAMESWGRAMIQKPLETGISALYGPGASAGFATTTVAVLGALMLASVFAIVARLTNPYRSAVMIHGDARFANKADLKMMEANKQVGSTGKYLHLGLFRGQRISLIETLSCLMLAPPGTGKTVGFVVPSIAITDESSFLINDPKPELWQLTAGHRAALGPTYRLDWSAADDPKREIFNPSFNFLDPRIIPDDDRDTFVDALSNILLPDKEGGSDPTWQKRGRNALIGFTHFLLSKINDRRDADRYEDIPEQWHGKPASFAMLVAWLTETAQRASEEAEELDDPNADPMRQYMQRVIKEARDHGYHPRAITELQPLVLMADKERSGVMNTMETGLAPFKSNAVIERTERADFIPSDLRGMLTTEALERMGCEHYPDTRADWDAIEQQIRPEDWRPCTVYLCINQANAAAFAAITTLFFEVCSLQLLAYGPGERNTKGAILGPYPVSFMLDEFAKLAKAEAVITGPDLGRSKQTYYQLVAQDGDQIEKTYGRQNRAIILSTTAIKIILPQMSNSTMKEISDMVGRTTVKQASISRTTGLKATITGGNRSENTQGTPLLQNGDLSMMELGTHILLVQNFLPRPMQCRSPRYWEEPSIASRVYNPRTGSGPPPPTPLPHEMHKARISVLHDQVRGARLENQRQERRYYVDLDRFERAPELGP